MSLCLLDLPRNNLKVKGDVPKIKWRKWLFSSGIGVVSVVCLIAASNGALGSSSNASALPDASVGQVESVEGFTLPDDSNNIGMTETELKALAAGKGMERQPELTREQQAVIEQEEASHMKIVETGTFDISQDEVGRKFWSVAAYGGLTAILEHYVHGFSKISFRCDDSVTIKFLPEATTSDRVQAAQLALSRIEALNEVYVEIYDVGTAVTSRGQLQAILNQDKAKLISEKEAEAIFQDNFKMLEI